jgi:hypothetical protein
MTGLQPTRPAMLASVFVLAASFGWSLLRLWPKWFDSGPAVPWLAAVTMIVLFVTVLLWALIARPRLQPERGKPRLHPLVAARTVALAMAASRVGALAGGFYAGFLVVSLGELGSESGRQRVFVSASIVVASIGTVVAALWLERMCQIPKPPADGGATHGVSGSTA